MSRKAEYDNAGAEDPRGDSDLPEWLEEAIAGKSKREQERIIRGYREEAMTERMNPMQRDGVRVEVLKPSGHLKVSAIVDGKREWIRYAGLSREEAVDDFKEVFKLHGKDRSIRRNPRVNSYVEIEYSHGGNLKTISVPFEQSSKTIKKILSTGAMIMKVKGTVPTGETLQSVMKKIRPVRRNPYVESGAYIIPDNDINRQASKMG